MTINSSLYQDCLSMIPYITPAIKENTCDIDYQQLGVRWTAVWITFTGSLLIDSVVALITKNTRPLIIHLGLLLCSTHLISADLWLSNRAADFKAAREYIDSPCPTRSATSRIQCRPSAAQKLADLKGDFNKVNKIGERLLSFIPQFEVFKIFIDNKAKLTKNNIQQLIKNLDPRCLEYAIKKGLVTPKDFSPDEQVTIWVENAENKTLIATLKEAGFNPNIQNSKGYGPLHLVVKDFSYRKANCFSALLQIGANPKIKCRSNNGDKNKDCIELNSSFEIEKILQQYDMNTNLIQNGS